LKVPKAGLAEEILIVDSGRQVSIDLPLQNIVIWEKRDLRVETPEDRRPESIVVVDLEGSYVSTDHGDLGSRVEGGKEGR
jgi:hypothetical protein